MKNLFLIILVVFASCSKDSGSQVIVSTRVDISIKNVDGIDLLDPENDISFKESDIEIFYLVDDEPIVCNQPSMDYSKGFVIYKHQLEYRIRVFPNDNVSDNYPITIIKWNDSINDTLKCDIERKENSTISQKIWFNEKLVWDISNENERFFSVIK